LVTLCACPPSFSPKILSKRGLSSVNNVRATNQGYTFERLAKIPISETIEGSKEPFVFLKNTKLDVPLLELTTSYITTLFYAQV